MKRFFASMFIAIALLISGVSITQHSVAGIAYADDGGGE
jgi:hypothetical protein